MALWPDVVHQGRESDPTFHSTFSHCRPTSPNSFGSGLSQQLDCTAPIAAIRLPMKKEMLSPDDTSFSRRYWSPGRDWRLLPAAPTAREQSAPAGVTLPRGVGFKSVAAALAGVYCELA